MTPTLAVAERSWRETLRYFFWEHPEWWTLGLAGGAWAAMLPHAWQYAGHGVYHRFTLPQEAAYWLLMVAAMMLPTAVESVRYTATASLWTRRHRGIAGFLAGYFAFWLGPGLVVAALRQLPWMHTYAAPAVVSAAAVLWQKTVYYRRGLTVGRRTLPLAPMGWQADRDCFRFGRFIGWAAWRTCWPLMVGCGLSGHGLAAMAGGLLIGLEEHRAYRRRRRPVWAWRGTLVLAVGYAIRAVWELRT